MEGCLTIVIGDLAMKLSWVVVANGIEDGEFSRTSTVCVSVRSWQVLRPEELRLLTDNLQSSPVQMNIKEDLGRLHYDSMRLD